MEINNEERSKEIEQQLLEARSKFFADMIIDRHTRLQKQIANGLFKPVTCLADLVTEPKIAPRP